MSNRSPPYPRNFRRRMIELVLPDRLQEERATELEPAARMIRKRDCQRDRNSDGLTSAERGELPCLKQVNRHPRYEQYFAKICVLVNSGAQRDPVRIFQFLTASWVMHPVATTCQLLGTSTSEYHAVQSRAPPIHVRNDVALVKRIKTFQRRSLRTCGVPRIRRFFDPVERDRLGRRPFQSCGKTRIAGFELAEGHYSTPRWHAAIGYLSLIDREWSWLLAAHKVG